MPDASPRRRVVLADDHALVLSGLTALLQPTHDVVASVDRLDDLPAVLDAERPDLLVLDVWLHHRSSLDVLPDLLARHPGLLAVVLTGDDSVTTTRHAQQAGASAVVLKDHAPDDLRDALEVVARGGTWLPADRRHLDSTPTLPERDLAVLRAHCDGCTAAQIAEHVIISTSLVEKTLRRLRTQFGVQDRAGLVAAARQQGYC